MATERREQVFVSSTYLDLVEERQAVIQTLLQADCFPAGMELFPASDDEKWDLIRRVIDESDYYVLVIGGRYGSTSDDGLSYTEKEFDYAVAEGKPVMAFLHESPGSISVSKTDITDDAQARLSAFRAKAEKRMARFWDSPDSLAGQVALSLIAARKTHPAEGWIRASSAASPQMSQEISRLSAENARLREELQADDKEEQRALEAKVTQMIERLSILKIALSVRYTSPHGWGSIEPTPHLHLFDAAAPLLLADSEIHDISKNLALEFKPDQSKRADLIAMNHQRDLLAKWAALGLVQLSTRKRSVNDGGEYWMLTDFGRKVQAQLALDEMLNAPVDEPVDDGPEINDATSGTTSDTEDF